MKGKINAACAVMAGFFPSLNKTQKQMVLMLSVLTLYVVLQPAHAAVTGAAFKTVYDFIFLCCQKHQQQKAIAQHGYN